VARFTPFASGSGGNCGLYEDGPLRILIDAGTRTKFIAACLAEIGLVPRDLTHVLITHSHSDHVAALPVLMKHTAAQLVCSADTYDALASPPPDVRTFIPGDVLDVDGLRVETFATPHDAPGSCGFVQGTGAARFGYCTDLGQMTLPILRALSGCRTVFLESNHDVDRLKNGPYPAYLKRRILSADGHLSNAACAEAVVALCRAGARLVVICHLSHENNTPALARAETERALCALGAAGDVALSVAPALGITPALAV
jgi:phosphoribosyl 1,2-cyclic phosphodiesterase